jgi:hypothetical protein
MNLPTEILAVLGIIAALGVVAAYFARSRGQETIRLLQTNIQSYKDSEALKDAKILALQVEVQTKDNIIKALVHKAKK